MRNAGCSAGLDARRELAALLATAFRRLTQKPPTDAVSPARESQKELDVRGPKSAHVTGDPTPRRA